MKPNLNIAVAVPLILLSCFFGLGTHLWAQSPESRPDIHFYYKIFPKDANLFRAMDVVNGGEKDNFVQLAVAGDFSGQFWRFKQTSDSSFNLTTLFRGTGMCADIFNGGPNDNQPHLVTCADFSGQFWFVNPTSDNPPFSDSFFAQLKTKFRPNMCLDHFQDGDSFFPRLQTCSGAPSQIWLISNTQRRVD